MATNGNGNGCRSPISFSVALMPIQFWLTFAALIGMLTAMGVKYQLLCTRVDAAFIEMDARTARRDKEYTELKAAIDRLTLTVAGIRDDLLSAGVIKPGAIAPIGGRPRGSAEAP